MMVNTTTSSATVSLISSTIPLSVGLPVSGPGIPPNTIIASVSPAITLSNPATATASNVPLVVLRPAGAPIYEAQRAQKITMQSEPDGVAFHAQSGFVVTLNESLDCRDTVDGHLAASNPNSGSCSSGTTPTGGTITRFDFGSGYVQPPTQTTTFASDGFRGDLLQVGADGCIYATQAPLAVPDVVLNGMVTSGSAIITGLPWTAGLRVGRIVTGADVPPGTRIASIDSASQITLSNLATATNAAETLTFVQGGTRYDNSDETTENSIVRICGGFTPPPGLALGHPDVSIVKKTNGIRALVAPGPRPDQRCWPGAR
jgi:hypothetical protein